MLLAIDVGNTNMVFGIYEGDRLAGSFRLKTDVSRTADEIGLLATRYFAQFGLDANGVEDVIIASVVPPVMGVRSSSPLILAVPPISLGYKLR